MSKFGDGTMEKGIGSLDLTSAGSGTASRPARTRLWHYATPLGILAACIGLLVHALVQLSEVTETMQTDAPGNMLWVLGQAEVEALRSQNALTTARLNGWEENSRKMAEQRYELLISRLVLLAEGPQQRNLEALGSAGPIAELTAHVRSLDPALQPFGEDIAIELTEMLSRLGRELNRAANRQMVANWESLSAQFARYRQTVSQVILSVAGVIFGTLLLGWQIIVGKRSQLQAQEARLRAIQLEQELKGMRATAKYHEDFAAIVSHQFRTPLAIIDSAAQRLVRGGKPLDGAALLERQALIRRTVGRLARLVDAALMAGQLDNGLVDIDLAEIDLAVFARDVSDNFMRGMPERKICVEVPDSPLMARCDPALLAHVIMNLLDNALKYSRPDAPVSLNLSVSNGRVGCTVADRGSGIAEADLPHIFDRFRRGQNREEAPGSGIGLWIARRLVELQGGTLTAGNRSGGGATFTIWLPQVPAAPRTGRPEGCAGAGT
ncbi:HAMP domain-containing sensor histidine kinase [Hoeflea sp.]|uniref:sensor histidine kinase n=1 Tax=Hoeflea sp. TaxID=1940281 RepID=UPI0019977EDA|nr:HAMP domain-containing sensor histidine kinase [Hoeflea sp.]MBC7285338.1 HAMP domain-containing histidine kinase [Hoeflea sp.]